MAAYRWVDDLSHLQADCLYTGSAPGQTLVNDYGKPLPLPPFDTHFWGDPFGILQRAMVSEK